MSTQEIGKAYIDFQLRLHFGLLFSYTARTKRKMLLAILDMAYSALANIPVSTRAHTYEVLLASFIGVVQGYLHSNAPEEKKREVIGELQVIMANIVNHEVVMLSDEFQRSGAAPIDAIERAEQMLARDHDNRLKDYGHEFAEYYAQPDKSRALRLSELIYNNLNSASPIPEAADAVKFSILMSLAQPMLLAFAKGLSGRF